MTNREREVFQLIKEDPMISQKEIALKLSIERSSVAAHISNLTKKGYLKGKGYIVSEEDYCLVIGGANVDIVAYSDKAVALHDSNPGRHEISMGGVGRNIAENLSRLGVQTKLLTVIGNDSNGEKLLTSGKAVGIDFTPAMILEDERTSTYISILDHDRELVVAISDMAIVDRLDVEILKKQKALIDGAKVIVLDNNLKPEVIGYLLTTYAHKEIVFDLVSGVKAERIKDQMKPVSHIKVNLLEGAILADMSEEDHHELIGDKLMEMGIENVWMTLGDKGIYYQNADTKMLYPSVAEKIVNTTGAGDAFVAGLTLGLFNGYTLEEKLMVSSVCSSIALESENTVSEFVNISEVNSRMEALK